MCVWGNGSENRFDMWLVLPDARHRVGSLGLSFRFESAPSSSTKSNGALMLLDDRG